MSSSYRIILYSFIACTLTLSSLGNFASAKTIWVATNGNNNNPGTQQSPVADISRAVALASASVVDTIIVKPGTYIAGTDVDRNVYIKSQYGLDSATILNGALNFVPMRFAAGISSATVLEGFRITRGSPSNIRIEGVSTASCSPEIRFCEIFENSNSSGSGGGIYMIYSESFIHDNFFFDNTVIGVGGAIYCDASAAFIYNNEFLSNNADSHGGAIDFNRGSPTEKSSLVQNNIFRSNTCGTDGSAIHSFTGQLNILNNLFYQNVAEAFDAYGGAIGLDFFVEPWIQNNIFAGNGNYAVTCGGSNSGNYFITNAYYQNTPTTTSDCLLGKDDIFNVNPLFINAAAGDFRLSPNSPLIDRGTQLPFPSVSIDYLGYTRYSGLAVDIGPYEYIECNLVPNFDYTPLNPCVGETVTFADLSDGFYEFTIWDYGNGDADTIEYSPDLPTPGEAVYSEAGTYTVSMTLICPTDTVTITELVTVARPPDATPLADVISGCAPLTVSFFYEDSLTESSDLWNFGDGITSTLPAPEHEFVLPGSYNVILQRTNFCGTDVDTVTISVAEVPVVQFTSSFSENNAPLPVQFTPTSAQQLTTVEWDFGDGNSGVSTAPNLSINHVYDQPGIYTPTAIGFNDCGEGPEATTAQSISVFGFDLKWISADSLNAQLKTYRFFADTLVGPYSRNINLTATITPQTPRRGTVQATFARNPIQRLDTTTVSLQLSADLAVGDYLLRIIGKPPSNLPADTLEVPFYSSSASICEISPTMVDYDSVVIDSVRLDSVRVRNTAGSFSGINLRVLNVQSSASQFVPITTSSGALIPGAIFWVKTEFRPDALGRFDGVITIETDDPRDPIKTVAVTGAGGVERQPPVVESTFPSAESSGALINTDIEISFSELLGTGVLEPGVVQVYSRRLGNTVAGSLEQLDPVDDKSRWLFNPTMNFPPLDSVEVTVSGTIDDLVGNTLDGNGNGVGEGSPADDYTFTFYSGPAVYPGDCNNDGIVNEIDILPIGVFFGMEGPTRPSTGVNWEGKPAEQWSDPRVTYADADGNGTIDEGDVMVIGPNWGSTHQWSNPTLSADYDFSAHHETFNRLRQIINGMAGSDVGDRLLQVIEGFTGETQLPTGYSLWQNHPNPFNPDTRISYTLPEATHVRLTVHNILGQTVKELIDEAQAGGFKYVIWDGTDQSGRQVSSGVYFYRLETTHYLEIRKMMKLQ